MPDILLTHGYFLWDDEKERQIMKPYAPLGILYISAYLKREGFDVEVFDTTFSSKDALSARFAATPNGVVGV
jgi:anaerobic magnesium-protoporphyrin IX monomethyl ester cyclase